MCKQLQSLLELCDNLYKAGVPKSEIKSNLGTLAVHLRSNNADIRRSSTTGPLFELFRWEHLREEENIFPKDEKKKVGDTYFYEKADGPLNVVQLKWATGVGKKVLKSNLKKALEQLQGLVDGNAEKAPEGSRSIARVGLQNRSFDNALKQVDDVLSQFEFADTVQVDIYDVPNDRKHTVEVSQGQKTVRSTDSYFSTPDALCAWRTTTWSVWIFEAAEKMGHKSFAKKITELSSRYA